MPQFDRLADLFVGIWHAADPRATIDGPVYSPADHRRNEIELASLADVLEAESRRASGTAGRREEAERRVLNAFGRFAVLALGWSRRSLDDVAAEGFSAALREFPARARRFDPELPASDIYQAARNALTMFCLQRLLGERVELTPSVLAYSLLYPYTDNLLDDPRLDAADKAAFGRRLHARLQGLGVGPRSSREDRIFDLVRTIEEQHSRATHPGVFASLLAINAAQLRSLALAAAPGIGHRGAVRIAVEKGGTSVLADGYLVAGSLTPAQEECIYGLGVFLQLRDDLEDVTDDRAAGLSTVFSSGDGQCLDEPTARALAIGRAVLDRLPCFDAPGAGPVREIMTRSLQLTIADAAASFPARYVPAYLEALQRRSPFRFDALARHRRRLSRARGSLTGLLERWLEEDAA
jgi:hypothetical protein